MIERWARLMRSTGQEILEGSDVVGARATAQAGSEQKMVESSEQQRELWLMEALRTRRPHLPQQPEQIERFRMATEAQTSDGGAEIWRMATQTYGENELQDLKDGQFATSENVGAAHDGFLAFCQCRFFLVV